MPEFCDVYAVQLRELDKHAETRPLLFRAEARQAYANYARQQRRIAKRLKTPEVTAFDFYMAWRDRYMARMQRITAAAQAGKLDKMLTRVLLLPDDASVKQLTQALIEIRTVCERQALVDAVYNIRRKRARRTAQALVDTGDQAVAHDVERFVNYHLYRMVARQRNVVVVDRHANLLVRMVQHLRARWQMRKLVRAARRRLASIDIELFATEQLHNGLVARLFSLGIDLIEVLAARHEYEKALEKMSAAARKSPTKKLELYEKKTASIRSAYLDSVPGLAGLKDVQKAAKEIDDALLKVFDFDMQQCNDLMRALKRYRTLTRERKELELRLSRD